MCPRLNNCSLHTLSPSPPSPLHPSTPSSFEPFNLGYNDPWPTVYKSSWSYPPKPGTSMEALSAQLMGSYATLASEEALSER